MSSIFCLSLILRNYYIECLQNEIVESTGQNIKNCDVIEQFGKWNHIQQKIMRIDYLCFCAWKK